MISRVEMIDLPILYVEESSTPLASRTGRKLILSVDDEPSVLHTRFVVLSTAGYAVLSTTDGANALQLFANYPVDLVLLAYVLPEIDGAYIAQAMREYDPRVPIVMVSAVEIPEEKLAAVNRYLSTGEEPEALLRTVVELVNASNGPRLRSRA
ncbi:MAG TPA: response regulator [Candidatus Binatia bacterium]|nr:response regulator [Candidatus Binatia bacterium]